MSRDEHDPFNHLQAGPRPVHEPSRPAQVALLLAGAVALVLLVTQIVGGGGHGVVSGQDQSFGLKPPARDR